MTNQTNAASTRDMYEAGLIGWVELQQGLAEAGLTKRTGTGTGSWTFSTPNGAYSMGVRKA